MEENNEKQCQSFVKFKGTLQDITKLVLFTQGWFWMAFKWFDVCVTVHHWYNNINSQLDAIIIVLLIITISSTCFGR